MTAASEKRCVEKRRLLAELRETVSQLEGRGVGLDEPDSGRAWTFGAAEVDLHLGAGRGGGLALDGLHEWGIGTDERGGVGPGIIGQGAALVGLVAGLLQRLPGREGGGTDGTGGADGEALARGRAQGVLWILSGPVVAEHGRPYGPGLLQTGLDPADLLFVTARREADVAWAAEEGLKAGRALRAVVGVGAPLPFAASRRLSLAASEAGLPCLWLAMTGRFTASSAAQTRWRVQSAPSLPDPYVPRAPGRPVWELELVRARGAPPARFKVVWNDETGGFALAAALAAGETTAELAAAGVVAPRRRGGGRRAA